jgi:hypothetical protein
MDLLASFSELTQTPINQKVDSQDVLNALLGKSKIGRTELVIEGINDLAFRKGDWVLIPPYEGSARLEHTGTETGLSSDYQLYNLKTDLGQRQNLADQEPEKVRTLKAELEKISGD